MLNLQTLAGVVPPVFQFIENIGQLRTPCFADPLRRIDARPSGVIVMMLVVGIGVARVTVRVGRDNDVVVQVGRLKSN